MLDIIMCMLLLTALSISSYLMLSETLRYSHLFPCIVEPEAQEAKQLVRGPRLVTARTRDSRVCAPNHRAAMPLILQVLSAEWLQGVSTEGLEEKDEPCI